jgi:excisionase family DNA binding protein
MHVSSPPASGEPGEYRLPPLAKVAEVAIFLRTSEPTVRELIRTNRLHAVRCGRSIRVPRNGVEAFLAGDPASRK